MADKYDPDRMNAEDVDINDPDAVRDWLSHPNTQALYADIGRAARSDPPEVERARLLRYLESEEAWLPRIDELIAAQGHIAELRPELEHTRATLQESVDLVRARLRELDAERASD